MSEMSFTTAAARAKRAAEADGTDVAPKQLSFEIDDEVFFYVADPPGGALLAAASLASTKSPTERLKLVGTFLDSVLVEESRDRFSERLYGALRPIDLPTAAQVVAAIMEVYGGRPTEPSSPSPVG